MNEIIEIIKGWPVIVQGALGSGLFWLILMLAQKAVAFSVSYFSNHSKQQRISWLVSRDTKHEAFGGTPDDARAAYATSALIYRSIRHLYRGFTWLGLGLVVSAFTDIGLIIGGFGLIYYLLKAYEIVGPFKEGENTPEAWKAVVQELIDLGAYPSPDDDDKNNKPIPPTAGASAD